MERIIQENGGMFISNPQSGAEMIPPSAASLISSPPLTPLLHTQPSPIKKSAEAEDLYSPSSLSSSPSSRNGKLPNWLSFLYQRTSSNATFPAAQQEAKQEQRENKKKGILKTPKPIDYEALDRLLKEQLVIERSTTLTPKEIRKLALAQASSAAAQNTNTQEAPSIRKRVCRFSSLVEVGEAHSKEEYDRGAIEYIAKSLTPALALAIKVELNQVKSEMPVHEDSAKFTQFYPLSPKQQQQTAAAAVTTEQQH